MDSTCTVLEMYGMLLGKGYLAAQLWELTWELR